jgi:flagellar basal-body rod protein FlgG
VGGTPGQNGLGSVTQYYTEQSNVNVAEELVALIAAQRAYEITAKSVSASDQMLQKLGQL